MQAKKYKNVVLFNTPFTKLTTLLFEIKSQIEESFLNNRLRLIWSALIHDSAELLCARVGIESHLSLFYFI